MKGKLYFCTIATKNYLAHIRVLVNSLLSHHPDTTIFWLLVDKIDDYFDPSKEKMEVIDLSLLKNVPNITQMCFKYNVLELSTALKPYFLEYLFEAHKLEKLIYLDPDIFVMAPLDEIDDLLETFSIILTPHITKPLPLDDLFPNELAILQTGTFNLGFIATASNKETLSFLSWWKNRLWHFGLSKPTQAMFVDQKWMDLAPSLFNKVYILKDPGYNVAYWNLHERHLTFSENGIIVNNKPLKFFHFSGFDPTCIDSISRYQNRFKLIDFPQLKPLLRMYKDLLIKNGYDEIIKWPYSYSYFDNGVRIPDEARKIYWKMGNKVDKFGNPFETGKKDSFFEYYTKYCRSKSTFFKKIIDIGREHKKLIEKFPALRKLLNYLTSYLKETHHVSETSKCRERLKKYIRGYGVDIGYGGDPIVDWAITIDLPTPYTKVGNHPLNLGGDARNLYWFRDEVLDFVYSSHLLEDFENTKEVLKEWLRVLKVGGHLILYCPVEQVYREHCKKTGQPYNYAHKIEHFDMEYVKNVLDEIGVTEIVHSNPLVDDYSFELVAKKVKPLVSSLDEKYNYEIFTLRKALGEKQAKIDALLASTSWKITSPLRTIKSVIRKLLGPLFPSLK